MLEFETKWLTPHEILFFLEAPENGIKTEIGKLKKYRGDVF